MKNRIGFRPQLESLESRLTPATLTLPPASAIAAAAAPMAVAAPTLNDKVVSYLNSVIGKRVGGGECAHLATEALRAAGARFIRGSDSPGAGDYDWGKQIKVISAASGRAVDSAPAVACKPGDVLQYRDTRFSNGMTASHHTAIVAAVDAQGRPTSVYEQNFNGRRYVGKNAIDFSKLTAGWVRVYRADPRVVVAGRTEFTLVNNAPTASGGSTSVGTYSLGTFSLGAANTWNSYQTRSVTATGAPPKITVGNTTVSIANGAAYELFLGINGVPSIRKLA